LEALGVKIFNPPPSIEISRDKLYTLQTCAGNGIPVPKTLFARFPIQYELIKEKFGYPLIAKLITGSKGEAVWKLDSEDELKNLAATLDSKIPLIIQEFLSVQTGVDLRVLYSGGEIVGAMMRSSSKSFKANVHQGGDVKGVNVKPKLAEMVKKVAQISQLDLAGVDVLFDHNTYKLCEVNSSPGFEGLEKATGVNVPRHFLSFAKTEIQTKRLQAQKAGEDVEPSARARKRARVGKVSTRHHSFGSHSSPSVSSSSNSSHSSSSFTVPLPPAEKS